LLIFLATAREGRADVLSMHGAGMRPTVGDTPRVLGCRMEFFGALNRRAGWPSRPIFALHAAGAPQIARVRSWERGRFSHVGNHKSNSIQASLLPLLSERRCAYGLGHEPRAFPIAYVSAGKRRRICC
jgi:hypothetical protein